MAINEDRLYELLGANLRGARTNRPGEKLTQDALSEKTGVSRASISNIETGEQSVPLHVLYNLCLGLGVDIQNILPDISELTIESEQGVDFLDDIDDLTPKDQRAIEAVLKDI